MELQERLRARVQAGELGELLLLLEHEPVYTLGRRSDAGDLPMGEDWCRAQGIDVVKTQRGGKLTYHGPGQLVGYPIMRVGDVPGVRRHDGARDRRRARRGGHRRRGPRSAEGRDYTGVWVEDRKIASIGVHISRGVSAHGFAVNVTNDLAPFTWVVACGLPSVSMTSLAQEGSPDDLPCFRKRMAYRVRARPSAAASGSITPRRLGIGAPEPVGTLDP